MGFAIFERWSPEHALNNTFADVNESGVDGLKPHLTANALKTVESFQSVTDAPMIGQFTAAIMGGSATGVLLDKLAECKWTIKDVMKGSDTSKAIVGFNYADKMVGTIELRMLKEEKVWKIDGISTPKFDKVDV